MCTQGGFYVFQLMERYGCAAFVMFLNAFWLCLGVGWCYGADNVINELSARTKTKISPIFKYCWKYISPVITLVLLTWV